MRSPSSRCTPLLALLVLTLPACRDREPALVSEVRVVAVAELPLDPADPVWETAPVHAAPLLLQDLVEPRLLEASTPEVRVQAVTARGRVAFRLSWTDPTGDDLPKSGRFSDACAVQFPVAGGEADLPAPQMGEPGRPVEITYWRASWQATVDGRGDTIRDIYPDAAVDHYPFQAPSLPEGSPAQAEMSARYAPARALGNPMAGPRAVPVQDLIAEGPGTLAPGPSRDADGRGRRGEAGWTVVLARRLPEGLGSRGPAQVAFAVWQGDHGEVGARKMRTGWLPVAMAGGAP